MTRSAFWIGLVAVGLAAAWIFLVVVPFSNDLRFEADTPWLIGNSEDAFDYAGVEARVIQGTAILQIDPHTRSGMIEFDLLPDEALAAFLGALLPKNSVVLRMQLDHADAIWTDQIIHGDSEIGDSRLPETLALHAGVGPFELLIDGTKQIIEWTGFWSIGDALRQSDGAIRNQGLVFTPLLRDQSVFSDPTRMEFTLLLYAETDAENIILHLVFPNIRIVGG